VNDKDEVRRFGAAVVTTEHVLKCWPPAFRALLDGSKTCEYRRDDRGFAVGDTLVLKEFAPAFDDNNRPTGGGEFSGRVQRRLVTHITRGPSFGVPDGFVVMSLAVGKVVIE